MLAASLVPLVSVLYGEAMAHPQARPSVHRVWHRGASPARPLVFGIYPGGAAGTVGPSGTVVAEDPVKRLAALETLRVAGKPFVVHLYASYTGRGGGSAADQLAAEVGGYESAGFDIELVLCYRPSDGGSGADVAGFGDFARVAVRAFGRIPRFASLQVTNEANVGGAPNANDGSYRGATQALIAGVVAAKSQARASRLHDLKVGFNWAYATDSRQAGFWKALAKGGSAFARSVDWVGLDIYPGTWSPRAVTDLVSGTHTAIRRALSVLRRRYMPLAGIAAAVPIQIAENGYPTGPGRTVAMQAAALESAIAAVNSSRGAYNVTGYRWFDLRDADSSSPSVESHYGLMTDDYTAKPAFSVYHGLIAALG